MNHDMYSDLAIAFNVQGSLKAGLNLDKCCESHKERITNFVNQADVTAKDGITVWMWKKLKGINEHSEIFKMITNEITRDIFSRDYRLILLVTKIRGKERNQFIITEGFLYSDKLNIKQETTIKIIGDGYENYD